MEAAAGVVSVVNHGMAEALRIVSVERGHDAREFSLAAFGGAGPVHAAALAEELGIPEVRRAPHPRRVLRPRARRHRPAARLVAHVLRPHRVDRPRRAQPPARGPRRKGRSDAARSRGPGAEPRDRTGRGLPLRQAGIRVDRAARGRNDHPREPGRAGRRVSCPAPPHLRAREPRRIRADGERAGDRDRADAPGRVPRPARRGWGRAKGKGRGRRRPPRPPRPRRRRGARRSARCGSGRRSAARSSAATTCPRRVPGPGSGAASGSGDGASEGAGAGAGSGARRPGPFIVEEMDCTVVVPPGWRRRPRRAGIHPDDAERRGRNAMTPRSPSPRPAPGPARSARPPDPGLEARDAPARGAGARFSSPSPGYREIQLRDRFMLGAIEMSETTASPRPAVASVRSGRRGGGGKGGDRGNGRGADAGPAAAGTRTDAATFEVVKNSLHAVAEEMKVVLAKTAYSPILKVAGDYSCGVFDAEGSMVAQGPDLPIHLGSMPDAVRAVIRAWDDVEPGDVFVHNDPYFGGSHLPDVNVVSPAFVDGALLGFCCVRAHWAGRRERHPGQLRRGDRGVRGRAPPAAGPHPPGGLGEPRRGGPHLRQRPHPGGAARRPPRPDRGQPPGLRAPGRPRPQARDRELAAHHAGGDGLLRGDDAGAPSRDPGRGRVVRGLLRRGRDRRPRRQPGRDVRHPAEGRQARRCSHRRFHRLRPPGRRADERPPLGHRVPGCSPPSRWRSIRPGSCPPTPGRGARCRWSPRRGRW